MQAISTIRVLVVDDDRGIRRLVREVLKAERDIVIVAEGASGQDALVLVREHAPDIVLMDVDMPVMNGIDATRLILAEAPGVKVLIFSAGRDLQNIDEIFAAGASGFVAKFATLQLPMAIRRVVEGRMFFTP